MDSIRAPLKPLHPFARRFALIERLEKVKLLQVKEQSLLFNLLGYLEFLFLF